MPSLNSIVIVVAALLLTPNVRAANLSPTLVDRFSVSGTVPAAPPFTLLDPTSLLPPLASLDTATALADGAERADQLLRDDAAAPPAAPGPRHPSKAPLSYSLAPGVTADFDYTHAQLFDRAPSQTLRDATTAFSTRPDRDVLDLNMSWHLAGSTVGLGYQLESARSGSGAGAGELGMARFLPGSQQSIHSLMLGLSRQWGGDAAPPVLVEPPLLPPEIDVAEAAATPTP